MGIPGDGSGWRGSDPLKGRYGYQDYRKMSLVLLAVTLVLSFVPEGLDFSTHELGTEFTSGSVLRRVQWLPLFGLAFYIVWRKRLTGLLFLADINPFFIAFTAYLFLSLLWSPEMGPSFRRLVQVAGAILIVLTFVVTSFEATRFARLLRIAAGGLVIASFMTVLLVPSIGINSTGPHVGSWSGLAQHKNHMGALAAISFIAWLHGWLARDVGRWRALGVMAVSLLMLLKASSSTALALAGIGVMGLFWLMRPPLVMRYWIMATLGFLFVLLLAATYGFVLSTGTVPTWEGVVGPIAELFGKDATLTGRDVLWTAVYANFLKQPFFGYGYGAFWLGDTGPSGELAQVLGWIAFQAHNGYLDILNETGMVGFWLFLMYLVTHFLQITRLYSIDRDNASLHLVLLVFVLVGNWTESFFFRPMTFIFILLTWSSLAVDRHLSVMRAMGRRQQGLARLQMNQLRAANEQDSGSTITVTTRTRTASDADFPFGDAR